MERRLSAILAADVVGYSRLMETDEAGTFDRVRTHRQELFEPEIAKHHGRIFKLMGDGLLAEFGSVVDAVECAVALQRSMAERNAGLAAGQRIELRMGINLGDVIVEGEDRHGDGVNIAARLQTLAEAGGIILSGTAYDQLKKKIDVGFEFLGEQQVKNIAGPVRVYRVLMDPAAVGKTIGAARKAAPWSRWPAIAAGMLLLVIAMGTVAWLRPWEPRSGPQLPSPDKPSIVVLPFENLSDDKEQGYLADGMTDDLTTDLAQVPGLFVTSRNAAFSYKGKNTQPAQVAAELGIRYVLEGSIRRAGNDMRINAQLIDAKTGGHLWAERFDGAWADVFSLQNKVVTDVAQALELRLVSGKRAAAVSGGTSNAAAYDAYLKGWELIRRFTPEDNAKAIPHFEQAIALDPNYGQGYAGLAEAYIDALFEIGWQKPLGQSYPEIAKKLTAYLQEALKHPTPEAYRVNSYILQGKFQFDEAVAGLERAIALDPSDAESYAVLGEALIFAGRIADGKGYIDAAVRLDPRTAFDYSEGLVAFSLNRFEEAAAFAKKQRSEGAGWETMMLELSAYGHLGRSAEAASLLKEFKDDVALTILFARSFWSFKEHADSERVLDGLRKAGVPELPSGYDAKSNDKLTAEETKSLVFGHELRGRQIESGDPWMRTTSADGSVNASLGSSSDSGITRMEDDAVCTFYPTLDGGGKICGVVFRNPGGTLEKKNEYLLVQPMNRFEFSVVK
jgi:TolB-like protein/class 3 adenylate cyclase